MKKKLIIVLFTLIMIICAEGRKTSSRSRSSGSGRGSSRKTNSNPQPAPTSFSYPQPSAPKPSLFGWQEKPAQNAQKFSSKQSKPSNGQSHSYPSSQTGLSGNSPKQSPNPQDSLQKNSMPHSMSGQQLSSQPNSQSGHSYPSSNGLSGNSGGSYPQQTGHGYSQQQGAGYPRQQQSNYPLQGSGLSGSGAAPPPYSPYKPGDINQPSHGGTYQTNNYGNSYHHPQGPPPPYTNYGGYGGYGHYNPGYNPGPQMPGYFGNYANKGFGGVSRTGSALTGVGIAGAGVGTLLTGLALWNLARSTGQHHHTVIYDNRGQPVAVAPANNTAPVVDPMLADLVNCSLTISNGNTTEILAIPCSIATSFTPDANVKDVDSNNNPSDNTKCTVTVLTKAGKEFMTMIPCSILLKSAAENNVTEAPLISNVTDSVNSTIIPTNDNTNSNRPSALRLTGDDGNLTDTYKNLNCTPLEGDIRDPINPCYSITHNITVIPLHTISNITDNIKN